MNTQLETVSRASPTRSSSHDMEMLIKSHSSILANMRSKLNDLEQEKNLNIKAVQAACDARLNNNDQRIAEMTQAIAALTQENGELQVEKRASVVKLEASFQNDEARFLTMIEATQKALAILKGE